MTVSHILKSTLVSILVGLFSLPLFAEPVSQQPEPKKLLLPPSSSDSLEELEKKLGEMISLLKVLRDEVEHREMLLKEAQEQLAPLRGRLQDLQEKLTHMALIQAASEEQLKRAVEEKTEAEEKLMAKTIAVLEQIPFPSSGIVFQSEQVKLSREAEKILDRAVELLQANPGWFLKVEGHTDSMGDEKFNLLLSQKRAESIRDYLIEKGINPDRLEATGFGEQSPIAPNTTAEGRALNRRIVFKVITKRNALLR